MIKRRRFFFLGRLGIKSPIGNNHETTNITPGTKDVPLRPYDLSNKLFKSRLRLQGIFWTNTYDERNETTKTKGIIRINVFSTPCTLDKR